MTKPTEAQQYALDGIKSAIAQFEDGGYFSADYISEKLNTVFRDKGISWHWNYRDEVDPSPVRMEESPSYRQHMRDAGRGGLLR